MVFGMAYLMFVWYSWNNREYRESYINFVFWNVMVSGWGDVRGALREVIKKKTVMNRSG